MIHFQNIRYKQIKTLLFSNSQPLYKTSYARPSPAGSSEPFYNWGRWFFPLARLALQGASYKPYMSLM